MEYLVDNFGYTARILSLWYYSKAPVSGFRSTPHTSRTDANSLRNAPHTPPHFIPRRSLSFLITARSFCVIRGSFSSPQFQLSNAFPYTLIRALVPQQRDRL